MKRETEPKWIRRDRSNGEESPCSTEWVKARLISSYHDIDLAMNNASKANPLTTGFADYYPAV